MRVGQHIALWSVVLGCTIASADAPTANYILPAGAQRGTSVLARIGGCNLHAAPRLHWNGRGVIAPAVLERTEAIWFEGPLIPQPASQAREDYPRDFAASLTIANDAPLGRQTWRMATSQGVTSAWGFVIGDLPEVVETEVEGEAPATPVSLPITINGRIFPREDVDEWSFPATTGQTITCDVATSAFGSPLNARIAMLDANGRVLGESLPAGKVTPRLRFVAPSAGDYRVRIHDVSFGGLQDHVYRLTVTAGPVLDAVYPLGGRRGSTTQFDLVGANLTSAVSMLTLPSEGDDLELHVPDCFGEVRLDLDDLDELRETESGGAMPQPFVVPSVLNGRIETPGDADRWTFAAVKGTEYDFEVRAARLGSPLDAVLSLEDATGKAIAEADDTSGLETDARLRWTAPADGDSSLVVRDRLPARGDARFAYRLRAMKADRPDFALTVKADAVNVDRGGSVNVKVALERGPGFKEPVEVRLDGLPAGVTMPSPLVIAANKNDGQFTLKAESDAHITAAAAHVTGVAKVGEVEVVRRATFIATGPDALGVSSDDHALWVAVAVPTPFKFVGAFETKYISRGSVFVRQYRVDRNGFDGPLEVQLADRQGRHLQGVTAAPVTVPAGESDFEFAVALPPWMEIGRTCRSTLAVSGVVTDADGTRHTISFSSNDQNNQMIALVDPGRLAIQLPRATITAKPGERVEIPVRVQRGPGVTCAVTVELQIPRSTCGASAARIEIPASETSGTLTVEFARELTVTSMPPLVIRATTRDERNLPVTAEAALTLVSIHSQ